jgi:Domain of unknown function (DUF4704)
MDGTYHIFTRKAMDVLHCVGGIAVLFPLFAQLDGQDNVHLNANVLKLLYVLLLSRVSPKHMTIDVVDTMYNLVTDNNLKPFHASALKHWLADFTLWVFTPLAVQVHVVQVLQRVVETSKDPVMWRTTLTIRKVLDDLRLFYWFTPPADILTCEGSSSLLSPSHFEKPESKYSQRE